MKYWVYINDKVVGPYEEDKLAELAGFTPETLICTETGDPGTTQEWVKASALFDFADPATLTHGQLSAQDADSQFFDAAETAVGGSLTSALLAKIDKLMNEIEGMKGKLDDAIAASNAAQKAASDQITALAQQQSKPSTHISKDQSEDQSIPSSMDVETATSADNESLDNTVNLVKHAEQVVQEAQQAEQDKPADFLDEIQIDEKDNFVEKGNGEEVVLRSALDSLYNPQVPVEEEKEATFQDLLSPINLNLPQTEQPASSETETPKEEKAEPAPVEQDQREKIIDEITAPAAQEDAVLQAVEEAQKAAQEDTPAENVAQENADNVETPVEETPAETVSSEEAENIPQETEQPAQEEESVLDVEQPQEEPAVSDISETPLEEQEADVAEIETVEQDIAAEDELSVEKEPLDLDGDHPQLAIQNTVNEEIAQPEVAPEPEFQPEPAPEPKQEPEPQLLADEKEEHDTIDLGQVELTPLDDSEQQAPQDIPQDISQDVIQKEENMESVLELVPGRKLDKAKEEQESDGLISQSDLDDAFSDREQAHAEEIEPAISVTPIQQTLPAGEEFYNPKEMTEVQLKEGSTYLISDFIPPAETGNKREEVVAGFNDAVALQQQAEEEAKKQEQQADTTMIEIVPQQKQSSHDKKQKHPEAHPEIHQTAEDLTLSQIKLENTIKPKRGSTMDIKTVPMVKEPAASERLDLSDADLDLTVQHDMKEADFGSSKSGLTKFILGILVAVILMVVIYFMMAYLGLVSPKYNLLKSDTNAEETQTADDDSQLSAVAGQGNQFGSLSDRGNGEEDQMTTALTEVRNYVLLNGETLEQLINSRHPAAVDSIEWNITNAVEPDNYSILVKVPPENAQSFKISYRFNYNMITKDLEPTISDSKNLLDSVG